MRIVEFDSRQIFRARTNQSAQVVLFSPKTHLYFNMLMLPSRYFISVADTLVLLADDVAVEYKECGQGTFVYSIVLAKKE